MAVTTVVEVYQKKLFTIVDIVAAFQEIVMDTC